MSTAMASAKPVGEDCAMKTNALWDTSITPTPKYATPVRPTASLVRKMVPVPATQTSAMIILDLTLTTNSACNVTVIV